MRIVSEYRESNQGGSLAWEGASQDIVGAKGGSRRDVSSNSDAELAAHDFDFGLVRALAGRRLECEYLRQFEGRNEIHAHVILQTCS